MLKQTEVEWKIDGDVLHYDCTSEPWVVSFYSEMAGKLKIVSCVIQNMSDGSPFAVCRGKINMVVFELSLDVLKHGHRLILNPPIKVFQFAHEEHYNHHQWHPTFYSNSVST